MSTQAIEKAIENAESLARMFPEYSWQRRAVELLIEHARGRKNAKPVKWLLPRLGQELDLQANDFQNKVVAVSRKAGTPCFICSCHKGFYLATTREDLQPMEEFYNTRMAQEARNLSVMLAYAEFLD